MEKEAPKSEEIKVHVQETPVSLVTAEKTTTVGKPTENPVQKKEVVIEKKTLITEKPCMYHLYFLYYLIDES